MAGRANRNRGGWGAIAMADGKEWNISQEKGSEKAFHASDLPWAVAMCSPEASRLKTTAFSPH